MEAGITTNLSIDKEKDYPRCFIKEENATEVPKSLTYLPTIDLRAEKSIQKYGKDIGLLSEIQTGYPEFDKNVFTQTHPRTWFAPFYLPRYRKRFLRFFRETGHRLPYTPWVLRFNCDIGQALFPRRIWSSI